LLWSWLDMNEHFSTILKFKGMTLPIFHPSAAPLIQPCVQNLLPAIARDAPQRGPPWPLGWQRNPRFGPPPRVCCCTSFAMHFLPKIKVKLGRLLLYVTRDPSEAKLAKMRRLEGCCCKWPNPIFFFDSNPWGHRSII
jgi:hypothetical protein